MGFGCWSVGGAHVGPCFLSAGKQRQEIRLRATALLLSSASTQSSTNGSCVRARGRPRLCRIPWLWFGYCLVFCPVWSYNSFILSFISSFHFFIFFLHRRTETVRCSCQCSLALPSYIKNNSHIEPCGILSSQWEHPGSFSHHWEKPLVHSNFHSLPLRSSFCWSLVYKALKVWMVGK